jgi:hypothetical protein
LKVESPRREFTAENTEGTEKRRRRKRRKVKRRKEKHRNKSRGKMERRRLGGGVFCFRRDGALG